MLTSFNAVDVAARVEQGMDRGDQGGRDLQRFGVLRGREQLMAEVADLRLERPHHVGLSLVGVRVGIGHWAPGEGFIQSNRFSQSWV